MDSCGWLIGLVCVCVCWEGGRGSASASSVHRNKVPFFSNLKMNLKSMKPLFFDSPAPSPPHIVRSRSHLEPCQTERHNELV